MPADMFLEKLQAGLFGRPNNPAGALSDADLKAAQQQAMLAMGAQLLAAGGPSSQPVSLGQALGQGLMAGRQAQAGATDSALKSLLLKAQIEKAQRTTSKPMVVGAGGAVYDPVTKGIVYENKSNLGGKIGNFNPGDYTPESFAKFQKTGNVADLERYVTPANPTVQIVRGVPTVVQPSRTGGEPTQKPLSTLFAEMNAASEIASSKESGKQTGKLEADAKFDLPRVEQTVTESVNVIKALRDHPGLPYITGWASKLPIAPDTPQAAADALAKQVQGTTFLQAYQTLKGGGQITEVEGKKAESAIARLERAQSTEDYQAALNDLIAVLETGLERARKQSGGSEQEDPLGIR